MSTDTNKSIMIVALMAIALAAVVVVSGNKVGGGGVDEGKVKEIVKNFLMENPQVLLDSVNQMQARQQADETQKAVGNLSARENELYKDPGAPIAGNPKGDVTVVEFFDYNCGYCKRLYPAVAQLLQQDKNVRVVFKEFPILSPTSETAAKMALAVHRLHKEKYFAFHTALMTSNDHVSDEMLAKTVKDLGVDVAAVKKEMESPAVAKTLEKDHELGMAIGVRGTPALVIGKELIPGAIDLDAMKARIKAVREAK